MKEKIRTMPRSARQNLDSSLRSKIAVIGAGGKTGTMFAFELAQVAHILGVGKEKEVTTIKEKKLFVKRKGEGPQVFEEKVITDSDFSQEEILDIIFLTVKNPISPVIKYYFPKLKDKEALPTLLLSQNGVAAISDAQKALKEALGENSQQVRLIRIVLFNPIDLKKKRDEAYIKYSLPVRIALAKVSGPGNINDIIDIFEKVGFQIKAFSQKEAKNLEYSKLFLNLIGMASASYGLSVKAGFENNKIFKEEVESLKEYIKAVKLAGGKFVNFPRYPVKILAVLFGFTPTILLLPLRNILAQVVSGQREDKPKVLDEIDYYNGAVVELGKIVGMVTPVNEKIYKRVLAEIIRG